VRARASYLSVKGDYVAGIGSSDDPSTTGNERESIDQEELDSNQSPDYVCIA
jgi:hypothetical protein